MRRWQVVITCVLISSLSTGLQAKAGNRVGGSTSAITVTASVDKKSARADTGRPGAITSFPRVSGCRTWTTGSGQSTTVSVTESSVASVYSGAGVALPFAAGAIATDLTNGARQFPATFSGFFNGSQTLWIAGGARSVTDSQWAPLRSVRVDSVTTGTPVVKNRWCEGLKIGSLCTPPGLGVVKWCFTVAPSTADGEETAVIRPPEPAFFDHGHWFTQRLGYVWIDAVYGGLQTVRMVGDPGAADLLLVKAVFSPGISTVSGKDGKSCSLREITTPYDSSRPHSEQGACAFIYYKSSVDERLGGYETKVRLYWRVVEVRFDSGARQSPANLVLETDALGRRIVVEEIQSVVGCKSINANGCG
jgi:hypothetical protein